jgi:SAM-dependent methyltransferase
MIWQCQSRLNMKPTETGRLYDNIAPWWDAQEDASATGLRFVHRAIGLAVRRGKALDVGCGSGGRIINALSDAGFQVIGLDVSAAMLELARRRHPNSSFIHADICVWRPAEKYDAIVAWDSVFHAPYAAQRPVIEKLCGALAPGGVLLFTAGGVDGEITGEMCGQTFYYSSLAAEEYWRILTDQRCTCILFEHDQYPETHLVVIGITS